MIENLIKNRNNKKVTDSEIIPPVERDFDGLLIVNKDKGPTSFDVVRRLRRITNTKRIGHTGTLDPFATGVLVFCLGKGTKIVQFIDDWEKEYIGKIKLGEETDSYDSFGKTEKRNSKFVCDEESIGEVVGSFKGEIWQTPPVFSAIKHKGKRLYQLAREGKRIGMKKRKVTIKNIEVLKIKLPFVCIRVRCFKGTYIRSLGFDVGRRLGCGAHLFSLCRTRVGPYRLKDSFTQDRIEKIKEQGGVKKIIIPIEKALEDFPSLVVFEKFKTKIRHGQEIKAEDIKSIEKDFSENEKVVLKDDSGKVLAIGQSLVGCKNLSDNGKTLFKYKRVLW